MVAPALFAYTFFDGKPYCLGACLALTVLLRRTIYDHLLHSRPEKTLNAFE